jgi:Tfp pilus assembly protein PilO
MRLILGLLAAANLAATALVVWPPGGSVEQLETELASRRAQLIQKRALLERSKAQANKLEQGRAAAAGFEKRYFTDRRVASSAFVSEIIRQAKDAGIRAKEHAFVFEPVEGSDTLSMMTITASFEGSYADLVEFVNRIDRSERFLILDSLTAQPQLGGGVLNVAMKLNAFVSETDPAPLAEVGQ